MQFLLTYMHWLATRITVLYEHLPERERGLRPSHTVASSATYSPDPIAAGTYFFEFVQGLMNS